MSFCTVIACMDGRIRRPILDFLKLEYGYDWPDIITDPGPVKDLADPDDTAYQEK